MTLGGETESSNPSRLMFSIKIPIMNRKKQRGRVRWFVKFKREISVDCLIRFNFVPFEHMRRAQILTTLL